ncbi:MAG: alpha/beta hydrolase [Clostridia bacterium]|nr:alpha/beta hydrolase [Clostridia bacterium]
MECIYKNTKVIYDVLGEGKTLIIFLHGWGASSRLMMPLYKKISQYDNNFSYLLIDLPPFGMSEDPIEPWQLDDYVNLTQEIINRVDWKEKIYIIGHSFGGRIGIKLASKIKIDKLILLASAGIKPKFSLKTQIKIWKYKFYKKIGSRKAQNLGSKDYRILSPVMKKTFNNIIREDLTKKCEEIEAKTLIIFGNKDKETPLYMGKILNKKIPNSRLVIVKNGDHFAYIHYLNAIFPLIYSFLNSDT